MTPRAEKSRGEPRGQDERELDLPPPVPGEEGVEDGSAIGRGRSAASPGHLKKAAGAQSARDFAPGRSGKAKGAGLGKRGRA